MDIASLLKGYDLNHLTVGVLGGHSALDVCHGAKSVGLRTVCVARKGREKTYEKYYRVRSGMSHVGPAPRSHVLRGEVGIIDDVIVCEKFSDILQEEIQGKLRHLNTIFVHSRYFWVYFDDFAKVENDFRVPIYGSRNLLRLEERDSSTRLESGQPYNQYHLLKQAGIRSPKIFKKPEDIDIGRVVIVKAHEARRHYERGFFLATASDFEERANERIRRGEITEQGLKEAVIEEFVVGAPVNFNFFFSPLTGELELLGTDTRRQTNLDGFLRMLAEDQRWAKQFVPLKMIETGHIACTVKESILEKAFELGEKFVKATQNLPREIDPSGRGIIGPFALQGAVVAEEGMEDIVIFDVSLRIPGSPGTFSTPYSGYLYGKSMSTGERMGRELKLAMESGCLEKLLT